MTTASNSQENKSDLSGVASSISGKNSIEQISTSSIDEIREFVRIGRTGRRNAIADVSIDPNANAMSANSLAELMCKIECGDDGDGDGDGSGSNSKENQNVNNN